MPANNKTEAIYFEVHSKQGTLLSKNGKKLLFLDANRVFRVSLMLNDYLSATPAETIELKNINDFPVRVKTIDNEGKKIGEQFTIKAKEKKEIWLGDEAASKLYVESKAEDKDIAVTNENINGVSFSIIGKKGISLSKNSKQVHYFETDGYYDFFYFTPNDYLSISPANTFVHLKHGNYFPLYVTEFTNNETLVLKIEKNKKTVFSPKQDEFTQFFIGKKVHVIGSENPDRKGELPADTDGYDPNGYDDTPYKSSSVKADQIIHFSANLVTTEKILLTLHQKYPRFLHVYGEWRIDKNATGIFLKGSKEYYIDHLTASAPGNIKLKNINDFPVFVRITENTENFYFSIPKDDERIFYLDINRKLFAKRQTEKDIIPGSDGSKFYLYVYAEYVEPDFDYSATLRPPIKLKLYKNGKEYFIFEREGYSAVKLWLQDNDYIDIGEDETIVIDPRYKKPTKETMLRYPNEKRQKLRKIIVKNPNNFFIIVRADENLKYKTYLIPPRLETFIFFGEKQSKLFVLKGRELLRNQFPMTFYDRIIVYVSLVNFPETKKTEEGVYLSIAKDGKFIEKSKFFQPESITLDLYKNKEIIDGIDFLDKFQLSIKGKSIKTKMLVVSHPANRNILVRLGEKKQSSISNVIIKPGSVAYIDISLSQATPLDLEITNTQLISIKVYELDSFLIPFQSIPFIRNSVELEVDVLNTSIFELKRLIDRELHNGMDEKKLSEQCDTLVKLLYTTLMPKISTTFSIGTDSMEIWMYAVLLAYSEGQDKVIITTLALTNKFKELAKYLLVHQSAEFLLQKVKETDFYTSHVIDIMNRKFNTFLFELGIKPERKKNKKEGRTDLEGGALICMYKSSKQSSFWEDPWGFIADLPNYMDYVKKD